MSILRCQILSRLQYRLQRPSVSRPPRLPTATLTLALVGLLIVSAAGLATPSQANAGVAKGIEDLSLEAEPADSATRDGMLRELRGGLGTQWLRLTVSWAALEPARGEYSTAELERLDALVNDAHAAGLKIMLTTWIMPAWATDSSWWSHPPTGYNEGPQSFYPISGAALNDYRDLAELLARRYKGKVQAMENWNEPNMWMFLYPQRTADDPYFAARIYVRMLRAFHVGVLHARTGVRIIAGATAPVGLNDRYRTSPQRFARFLKRARAGRYFDGYSHHPYTPGGSLNPAPGQPPNDPSTTVNLYNLGTLLRLFPGKPFYLTEYGYNTQPTTMFGLAVSERVQARYLSAAYRYAARYRQVRLLVWYLLKDSKPEVGPADQGLYTGLRRSDGSRKPSWYVFRRL